MDYFENSPAKKIADHSYLISTANTEELKKLCDMEKINGIFTGYSEKNLIFTAKLCELINLPFYATVEQLEIMTNKELFKAYCIENGIPVTKLYYAGDNTDDINNIEYPCIVKPVDSYSGKGITICENSDQIKEACKKAASFSSNNRFLIEEYLDCKEYDIITAYYTIYNGEPVLSSIVDRFMYKFKNNRQLSTVLFYPSKYLSECEEKITKNIKSLIKQLHVSNGVMFLEGAVSNNNFKFWECGLRLCGAQQGIIPDYVNGIDCEWQLLQYSLTGKMPNECEYEDPKIKGKKACNLLLFSNPCTIKEISGLEILLKDPSIINNTILFDKGSTITNEDVGTLNQNIMRFHIVCETEYELYEKIKTVFDTIKIIDNNGNNQLMYTFK